MVMGPSLLKGWLLAVGGWRFIVGVWRLAVGGWRLVAVAAPLGQFLRAALKKNLGSEGQPCPSWASSTCAHHDTRHPPQVLRGPESPRPPHIKGRCRAGRVLIAVCARHAPSEEGCSVGTVEQVSAAPARPHKAYPPLTPGPFVPPPQTSAHGLGVMALGVCTARVHRGGTRRAHRRSADTSCAAVEEGAAHSPNLSPLLQRLTPFAAPEVRVHKTDALKMNSKWIGLPELRGLRPRLLLH